jgi:hypothetical protein
MRKVMLTATAILIAATAAQAQNPDEIAQRQIAEYKGMAERQAATEFKVAMAERVPLEKTIKGAPYAAEIVTETNQTLADGNRISRRTTGRVYRDNEGRVRREEDRRNGTVAITIVDGVAGVSYRLEPDTRIAWKTSSATTAALMKEIEEKRLEERRQRERERVGGEPARTAPSPPPPAPGAVLRTRMRHLRRRLRLATSATLVRSREKRSRGLRSRDGGTRAPFPRDRSATSSRSRSSRKNGVRRSSTCSS